MTMAELAESTDVAEMIEPMSVDSIDQRELAEQLLEQAGSRTSSWLALAGCWAS
jgi:hypothetical protein